jgi:hypothetical protein
MPPFGASRNTAASDTDIDQRHDRALLLADRGRLAVYREARDRQQPALLRHRQRWVPTFDQRATFRSAHLPSFRAKNRFPPSIGRSAGAEHRPEPAGRCFGQAAALKNTRGAFQQPLLPIGDLVRMDPELARQFGDRPVTLYRCQRHLGLECCASSGFASCPAPAPPALSRGRAPPYPTVSFSGSSSRIRTFGPSRGLGRAGSQVHNDIVTPHGSSIPALSSTRA